MTWSCPAGSARLASIAAAASGSIPVVTASMTQFDATCRVSASSQQIGSDTWAFTYSWNLGGKLRTEGYPSGSSVGIAYDAVGREQSVTQLVNGNPTGTVYASVAGGTDPANTAATLDGYTASGTMQRIAMGNGVVESRTLNGRLQPQAITAAKLSGAVYSPLLPLGFTYGAGGTNNGNVLLEQIVNTPGGVSYTGDFELIFRRWRKPQQTTDRKNYD